MLYFRHLIFFVSIQILGLTPLPCLASQELDWLAFGDIRGNIETCGCDPRTDLGGIERIASLIARERAVNPHILILDLGNNFHKNEAIKSKYLAHGLTQIGASASLVNHAELQINPSLWGDRSFVIGNLNKKHRAYSQTKPFIVHNNILILGYHWDEDHKEFLGRWNKHLSKTYKEYLDKFPKHQKVLLFSGPISDLHKIATTNWFNLIISSNTKHEDEKPGFEEKENPDRLLRFEKPFVRMVPLGGIGVLRGGKLMQKEAPSLAKLFESSSDMSSTGSELSFGHKLNSVPSENSALNSVTVSWLDYTFDEGSPLNNLMQAYNAETKEVFEKIAKSRLKDLQNTSFIGANACKTCHPKAFKTWDKSNHAHAYDTLENAGKDKDPECVSCHVLGFSEKGGFISKKESPQFAHVQCENCHGPGKAHAQNPNQPPSSNQAKNICVSCHHVPHSSNFVFDSYWKKIQHGQK
ncbi:MAG: multiheme c-type cytochrome [Oligoflexales bacterium]